MSNITAAVISDAQRQRLERRVAIVRAVRGFFEARGFWEVDTPVALSAPAPEVHIEAPAVRLHAPAPHTRYLQPSPELPMKRLLAQGWDKIFQLAPVFRDGDFTELHRPEFRLVEWYRSPGSWTDLMDDCEALLRTAAEAAGGGLRFTYRGRTVSLHEPFRRVTMDEAFLRYAGFSILDHLDIASLRPRVEALGLRPAPDDSYDDLFHRVFLTEVEPKLLADERPLFLTHYPAPLAALARLDPNDPRCAERFELYAADMELANAFGELTDASEQRCRFMRDKALRQQAGMNDYPLDERFLACLEHMPPCAGIALGLERLLMLLLDAKSLDDVSFIPWSET